MKYDEDALKDALIDGCIRKLKGRKAGSVETAYEEGRSYGKKHVKEPFTFLNDVSSASMAKKVGGELGRRQGERLSDYDSNLKAALGGKAAIEKRATELQTAPISDSVEVGTDFNVGYAMSAAETFLDVYFQNIDRGITAGNRFAEAFCAPLNIPVIGLPTFVDYGEKFVGLLRKGDIDAALALCTENRSEIKDGIPAAFVEYLRQKWETNKE